MPLVFPFIEGEDYFEIESDEIRRLEIATSNRGMTLLTESGYLLICKSLNDDRVWEVKTEIPKALSG